MNKTVVVLVEDDPMNRMLAIDALERAGYEVADFTRADEAARYAEEGADTIAALVADINLPGERDGLDLAQSFAARWPDKAILITSGLFGASEPADLPGGACFIAKPWTAKSLMRRMEEALRPHA